MFKSVPFCHMRQSLRASHSLVLGVLIAAILLISCSGSPEKKDIFDDPKYEGWQLYKYENIKILYQPGHPQVAGFEQIAKGYVRALVGVSQMLDMEIPEDSVKIIFYTGWGQGREMTGQQVPFVEDGIIHFWIPSHLGVTFMHWFLPYWVPERPAHEFLWHGLVCLFDYSGYDYHKMTLDMLEGERFVPLAELAVDTTIDSNNERRQSAEAASFVAFVLAWYGPDRMKMLYRTQLPFETLVEDSLHMSLDSLQTHWINVIRANQPPDSTETSAEE